MIQNTEQYRAGFEAWASQQNMMLARSAEHPGYAAPIVDLIWMGWAAAKREASTEPSAIPDVLFDGNEVYAEITRKLGKAHCHNHETVSATLDAVVRLMSKAGAGALTDDAKDAKDAARYRFIRDTANNGYGLQGPAGIGKWHTSRKMCAGEGTFFFGDQLDKMIDADIAAIAAHTRAGSGK